MRMEESHDRSYRYDLTFDTMFGHVFFCIKNKNSCVYNEIIDIHKVVEIAFKACFMLFNGMFIGLLMFDFVCMRLIPFEIAYFLVFTIMLALGYLSLFHNISISIIIFVLNDLIYLTIYLFFENSTWLGKDISEFLINFLIMSAVFGIVGIIVIFLLFYNLKSANLEKEVTINKERGLLKIIDSKGRIISYQLKEFDTVILNKYGKKRYLLYSVSLNGSSTFEIFRTPCKNFMKSASTIKEHVDIENKLREHCRKLSDFLSVAFTEKVIEPN